LKLSADKIIKKASIMIELKKRLGKEKDIALADEFGVTRQYVSSLRKSLGIPVYRGELHSDNVVLVSACVTKKDSQRMKKGMRKTGESGVSEYLRDAIRRKNREVLGDG